MAYSHVTVNLSDSLLPSLEGFSNLTHILRNTNVEYDYILLNLETGAWYKSIKYNYTITALISESAFLYVLDLLAAGIPIDQGFLLDEVIKGESNG